MTQWRESDLQFIQRILAEDGLWFRTGVNTSTGLDTVTASESRSRPPGNLPAWR
nr:phage late control D family protein [Cedecea lapagei]